MVDERAQARWLSTWERYRAALADASSYGRERVSEGAALNRPLATRTAPWPSPAEKIETLASSWAPLLRSCWTTSATVSPGFNVTVIGSTAEAATSVTLPLTGW